MLPSHGIASVGGVCAYLIGWRESDMYSDVWVRFVGGCLRLRGGCVGFVRGCRMYGRHTRGLGR